MTTATRPMSAKAEAILTLRKLLKPGATVYCVLRHVSSSGMTRRIDFYTIQGKDMRFLSGYIGKALDLNRSKNADGLVVGGCGMDMGFSVVYNLGRTLFPKGFKLRKGQHGRNGDTSGFDEDGGYALESRWL